tara:strand:- start:3022 stop:3723 length:702 start_codon:yes stop_codon:yes gene_type:complete
MGLTRQFLKRFNFPECEYGVVQGEGDDYTNQLARTQDMKFERHPDDHFEITGRMKFDDGGATVLTLTTRGGSVQNACFYPALVDACVRDVTKSEYVWLAPDSGVAKVASVSMIGHLQPDGSSSCPPMPQDTQQILIETTVAFKDGEATGTGPAFVVVGQDSDFLSTFDVAQWVSTVTLTAADAGVEVAFESMSVVDGGSGVADCMPTVDACSRSLGVLHMTDLSELTSTDARR